MLTSALPHHLAQLLRGDAHGTIQRHTGAGEQGAEQVALIALAVGKEASGVERAATATRNDEG